MYYTRPEFVNEGRLSNQTNLYLFMFLLLSTNTLRKNLPSLCVPFANKRNQNGRFYCNLKSILLCPLYMTTFKFLSFSVCKKNSHSLCWSHVKTVLLLYLYTIIVPFPHSFTLVLRPWSTSPPSPSSPNHCDCIGTFCFLYKCTLTVTL